MNKTIICERCGKAVNNARSNNRKYCSECQIKVRREINREYKAKKYAETVRTCAAEDCDTVVTGYKRLCETCRRKRKNHRHRYEPTIQYDIEPSGPPTNMEWMNAFKPYFESGLSYPEFQRRERRA